MLHSSRSAALDDFKNNIDAVLQQEKSNRERVNQQCNNKLSFTAKWPMNRKERSVIKEYLEEQLSSKFSEFNVYEPEVERISTRFVVYLK